MPELLNNASAFDAAVQQSLAKQAGKHGNAANMGVCT
jgi:hypothetical protein